jgi:hypothetical protein
MMASKILDSLCAANIQMDCLATEGTKIFLDAIWKATITDLDGC